MSTALLTRPAARDRAFERLYRRHVHEVYRYVLAVLRNQADAEDATQATFLSAFRAFTRGEEPQKPRNWLLKIAHNECRQRFRASARRPREVAWDERTPAPAPDETVPTADEIRIALSHLSFNQRSALVMRELEGRSYAEIGEILELSVSAVETVLFRARRALREQLEGGLTCGEAESALSRRLDGRLPTPEQRALRAHLRECTECAALERKQRARRAAVKRLGVINLPPSLASFLGGTGSVTGGAIAGSGLAAKAAAVVAAGVVAGGVGHEAVTAVTAANPPGTPSTQVRAPRPISAPPSTARRSATVRPTTERRSRAAPAASTGRVRKAVKAALGRRRSGARAETTAPTPAAPANGSDASARRPALPVSPPPAPMPPGLPQLSTPTVGVPPPPVPVEVPSLPTLPQLPSVPPVPPLPPLPPPPPPPLLP